MRRVSAARRPHRPPRAPCQTAQSPRRSPNRATCRASATTRARAARVARRKSAAAPAPRCKRSRTRRAAASGARPRRRRGGMLVAIAENSESFERKTLAWPADRRLASNAASRMCIYTVSVLTKTMYKMVVWRVCTPSPRATIITTLLADLAEIELVLSSGAACAPC
jgi:hypothetical protein